jgi:hypothetical protein
VNGGTTLIFSSEAVDWINCLDTLILTLGLPVVEILAVKYGFLFLSSFFVPPRGPPLYPIPQITPKLKIYILQYLSCATLGAFCDGI